MAFPSERLRNLLVTLISQFVSSRDEEAHATIKSYLGEAQKASDHPHLFSTAIDSGNNTDSLKDIYWLTSDAQERHFEIARACGMTDLIDWMLFLHPEQTKLVERDFIGPARVLGVSGSGKTCVLVHRAQRLAHKYPGENILLLSLNAALCKLIREMLDKLCKANIRSQIDVMTIHEYCTKAVKTIRPERLMRKEDPKSGETLSLAWRDFMQKRHAKDNADLLIGALEQRPGHYLDGKVYLLEELAWIRSGFGLDGRPRYLTCDRHGRGIPFPRIGVSSGKEEPLDDNSGFPPDARKRVLSFLKDYEEYMEAGGLADVYEVPLAAYELRHEIVKYKALQARCVLVDEVQDCSTVELAVVEKIPSRQENCIYLTGDPVQKVFPKQHDLVKAGIDIVGRGAILKLNYRNSKQILKAAYAIIDYYRGIAPIDEAEILEPEYAFRDGSRPILYNCASSEEQQELIMWYLSQQTAEEFSSTCVGSPNEETILKMESACKARASQLYDYRAVSRKGVGEGTVFSPL